MGDTLAGLTRRVNKHIFESETASSLLEIAEETSVSGADRADILIELALGGPGCDSPAPLSWAYGSASPIGQGAEVGRAELEFIRGDADEDDDEGDNEDADPDDEPAVMNLTLLWNMPDGNEEDPSDGEKETEIGDAQEIEDELEELARDDGVGTLTESAVLAPGEAVVY